MTIKVEQYKQYHPNTNIFCQDLYHMGTALGENVMILHKNFPKDKANYLIVVNTETGESIKLYFEKG